MSFTALSRGCITVQYQLMQDQSWHSMCLPVLYAPFQALLLKARPAKLVTVCAGSQQAGVYHSTGYGQRH